MFYIIISIEFFEEKTHISDLGRRWNLNHASNSLLQD
jgi:hypothetical protein